MRSQNYRTIFCQQPSQQQPKPNHPLFYYEHRSNFLSDLSDKYSAKFRLPTMDLKRNARIDYYLNKYEGVKSKIDKQQKKKSSYLNSNQFTTVFSECIDERRQKNKQKRQEERLKQDLQKFYENQQMHHEQPEHDQSINFQNSDRQKGQGEYRTVLADYRSDPAKQKELYLIDFEIGKLKFQQMIQKKVKQNHEMCRNQQLLSKLSNNILSAYMVHFDQIYDRLMDELLTEEVYYLNYLEAQYKIQKDEWNGPTVSEQTVKYENARTIQMMDLVQRLQDLCDQR